MTDPVPMVYEPHAVFANAMQRVLAIHYPTKLGAMTELVCAECSDLAKYRTLSVSYPCPTAKLILDAGVAPPENGTKPGR